MKSKDIDKEHPYKGYYGKWDFYDVEIKNATFEWPAPMKEMEALAHSECLTYLDQLFGVGRYEVSGFHKKEET